MKFLAAGTVLATLAVVVPAWWLGPSYLEAMRVQGWLSLEAWAGWILALTWVLRGVASLVFLRASGGRLRATGRR